MLYRVAAFIMILSTAFGLNAAPGLKEISGPSVISGQPVAVRSGEKGLVVIFMSAKCPCSSSHLEVVKELAATHKQFSFAVVHANRDESTELAKKYFSAAAFPFPVIQDEQCKWADELKAAKTPHAFVFSPDGLLLYKGGITNSTTGKNAEKQFLRDALIDVENGQLVRVAEGRTLGCAISRRER